VPNLAYPRARARTRGGTPNGRLHVIGNEGRADESATHATFKMGDILQRGWQDSAADGTVKATVELKPAFTSPVSRATNYLGFGEQDAKWRAPCRRTAWSKRYPATVVVNMPDYVPDMGPLRVAVGILGSHRRGDTSWQTRCRPSRGGIVLP